jgi:putative membrane protein
VRTAIALLGFGITLNRFSIYLTQEQKVVEHEHVLGLYDVEAVGIGMAWAGLVMLAWSLYRYRQTHHDLERGVYKSHFKPVMAITLVLLVLGGVSALWLLHH